MSKRTETAPIEPDTINPLIVPDSLSDTAHHVGAVLSFIASSMENAEQSGDVLPITGSAYGLSLVLLTCWGALRYHADGRAAE